MSAGALIDAARDLRDRAAELQFDPPVTHVYNPLQYAWDRHKEYLERYGDGHKEVVFLGMNPGPYGMAQTGVPFGDTGMVSGWLRIRGPVGQPDKEHPKRPIHGFDCERGEISGRRLWGALKEWFGKPDAFFKQHFIANYCPLVFMAETGRNITPDKLPAPKRKALFAICDTHLQRMVEALQPRMVVGIGRFAEDRARAILDDTQVTRILHPSPASPAANQGWAAKVEEQLRRQGVWNGGASGPRR